MCLKVVVLSPYQVVTDVDPVEVVAMAAACPDLVPRLLTGATQPEQQQPEQ